MLKKPYACAFCQETFIAAECLVSHVKTKHKQGQSNNTEEDIKNSPERKSQKKVETKIQHKNKAFNLKVNKNHEINEFLCKECSKSYSSRQGLHR